MIPRKTKAAILASSHEPLVIDEIDLPEELDVGQVLVRVLYTTVCGAQLNEIDAVKGPDKYLPHLLGHEAVGEVAAVGPGVRHIEIGDTVVMHWRPSQGIEAEPARYSWQGKPLNAGWVTTFQELAVVSENRLTAVDADELPLYLYPLFGCALTTAYGVVTRDANIKVGDSVTVIGAGGVGLPIIQFAKLAGAYPIYVDELRANRRGYAQQFGAEACDHVHIAHADKVIETTGRRIEDAYEATADDGTCVLVGVPHAPVMIKTLPLHFGKTLTGSHGGDSKPHIDIPRIVKLVKAGMLNLEPLVEPAIPLDKINDGIAAMRRGDTVGRILIKM